MSYNDVMTRIQIQLRPDQVENLGNFARIEGVSHAEVVRTALDQWFASRGKSGKSKSVRKAKVAHELLSLDDLPPHDQAFVESLGS